MEKFGYLDDLLDLVADHGTTNQMKGKQFSLYLDSWLDVHYSGLKPDVIEQKSDWRHFRVIGDPIKTSLKIEYYQLAKNIYSYFFSGLDNYSDFFRHISSYQENHQLLFDTDLDKKLLQHINYNIDVYKDIYIDLKACAVAILADKFWKTQILFSSSLSDLRSQISQKMFEQAINDKPPFIFASFASVMYERDPVCKLTENNSIIINLLKYNHADRYG